MYFFQNMKKILAQTALTTSFFLTQASSAFAQGIVADQRVDPSVTPFVSLGKLLSNAIQILIFVAGLFFFIMLIIGGLQWILSGGDKAGAQAARDRITSAFIGLVIVVAAFAITIVVSQVFGINILGGFQFRSAEHPVGF